MATSSDLVTRRRLSARRLRAALRRSRSQQSLTSPTVRAFGLVLVGLGVSAVMVTWPGWLPPSTFAPLVLLAGLYLTPGWLVLVSITYLAELVFYNSVRSVTVASWVAIGSIAAVVVIMLSSSRSRARLGVQGHHGESMFVDLRDRLRAFGELPELPARWHAEVAVESAYGQSFSGDFVVATRSRCGRWLEVVLVDVSGKGVQAGTRALLLSGALGGLLGETEPERFLGAANSYLVRQEWDEGFATAVHVSVDLTTGEYSIGNAGHPAAVQFVNGSGRWQVLGEAAGPLLGGTAGPLRGETAGPLLGVIEDATFLRASGQLARGDALVLYTDGVIETRQRDLTVGVDRMLGAAERLVPGGFAGGARLLCASAKAGETDDRAVVMIWRD